MKTATKQQIPATTKDRQGFYNCTISLSLPNIEAYCELLKAASIACLVRSKGATTSDGYTAKVTLSAFDKRVTQFAQRLLNLASEFASAA
jgi:hypothetical protein